MIWRRYKLDYIHNDDVGCETLAFEQNGSSVFILTLKRLCRNGGIIHCAVLPFPFNFIATIEKMVNFAIVLIFSEKHC